MACSIYWLSHLPAPGVAVGVLGLLAVVATFEEEPSRLQRGIWVLASCSLLFIEIQAISKDRIENQYDQENIRAVDQSRYLKTTADLKATLKAAKDSFDSAEKSRRNTIPHANIEVIDVTSNVRIGSNQLAPLVFEANKQLAINVFFHNTGPGSASNTWAFLKLYVDTLDSTDAEKGIAKKFEKDWRSSPHKPMGPIPANSNPAFQSFNQTLTSKETELLGSSNQTVYYVFRVMYEDQTGRWYQDGCGEYQDPLKDRDVVHACRLIEPERHAVTFVDFKRFAHGG